MASFGNSAFLMLYLILVYNKGAFFFLEMRHRLYKWNILEQRFQFQFVTLHHYILPFSLFPAEHPKAML